MEKRGVNIHTLDEIIVKLASGEALPAKNRDHALTGNYAHHRECHVAPDWLLVYRVFEEILELSSSAQEAIATSSTERTESPNSGVSRLGGNYP